ncbi:MAG: PD-(D/E)XK nuclease family protein [Longimicrobiales bacterium]|nr:PD-(D/E)XK nuclease family protein [Longimicrobiales bacterium]
MTPTRPIVASRLLVGLIRVSESDPLSRKLVLAPNMAAGREVLRRMTLLGHGWIGFEVTTPSRLAQRLAEPGLERMGATLVDAFDHQAILDEALDSALTPEETRFDELSEGVGFREKVHGAVHALRMASVTASALERAHLTQQEKKRFLLRVLRRYERLLMERRRADPATVFGLALEALDAAGSQLPENLGADTVVMIPGLGTRGLPGRLVAELGARGAKVLETDPVRGLEVPESILWGRTGGGGPGSWLYGVDRAGDDEDVLEIEIFQAASINAELREVLRRIVEAGLRWDQVEIVAADAAAYGSALHALSSRLRVPVTYAVGLPVARTRTGRVVQAYLDWVEEGFQADPIRRLLEAGDLRPPRSRGRHPPARLAGRFRSLRVGWGRRRYRTQLRAALDGLEDMTARSWESEEAFLERQERARSELEALRSILFPALKAIPSVPDRMGHGGEPISPSELARGLSAFLRRVPRGAGPDRNARDEVKSVLERVEATLTRRTDFRSCIAILRRHLDVRVRPELLGEEPDGAAAPWSSAGGAVHLSDLEHGGYSGREATFFVGFDADGFPGGAIQDPLLLDGDRRVLGAALPTSSEVLRERIFRVASLVARLRGAVTMSFCAWQPTEARTVGPSSILLQALRLTERDPDLAFSHLRERMGRVVNAIPLPDRPALDGDDVWMAALGGDEVLRRGEAAVRAAFPALDRGLASREARRTGEPGPVHGVVEPRPELDPRSDPSVVVSASRLEDLGACPLRYLHRSVLRAYPPEDPELDPDVWLDGRRRGTLLHAVYDQTLRWAREKGAKPSERIFEALALDALRHQIEIVRREVPSPGEGTTMREIAALREDVRSFVRMIRERTPEYIALELTFGIGEDPAVPVSVTDGTVALRGAIDRVDHDLEGIHVVDYKTGKAYGYGADAFDGGRRLQHALYALVAEERLGDRVVDGQYHFPTRRGQNQVFSYPRERLEGVTSLVGSMLNGIAAGRFVPTDEANDCTFCDYAEVCRVRLGAYSVESPLAEWAEEQLNAGVQPAFEELREVRRSED